MMVPRYLADMISPAAQVEPALAFRIIFGLTHSLAMHMNEYGGEPSSARWECRPWPERPDHVMVIVEYEAPR